MSNSNPQAIAFSNGRVRPICDEMCTAYLSAKKLLAEWQAQNIAAVIPNDANQIADGSQVDGRPLVVDSAVNSVIARLAEFVAWLETGQIAAGGVVTDAFLNQFAGIALNGRAIF